MFFLKHSNAARMNESSTREASKDRRIEEFDGSLTERVGKEKDVSDIDTEPAGS